MILPIATACTSVNGVPGGAMGSIKSGIVRDHDGDEVRIDPNSEIRFERTDGTWTVWRHASDLWVNDDGVLFPYFAKVGDLDRLRVEGLTVVDLDELRVAAGDDNVIEYGGAAELTGDVGPVLTRFLASRTGASSGTWAFRTRDGVWFDSVTGAALPRMMREGLVAYDGLRFADMRSAKVKNLNGGKTLVGVVAVSAVAVGLAAVIVLTKGKLVPKFPWKTVDAVAEAAARGVVHAAVRLPGRCCGSSGGTTYTKPPGPVAEIEPTSPTGPAYPLPSTDDAHRLFDGIDRRRANIRFGAAIDFGTSLARHNSWSGNAVGLLRITDLFELGGGLGLIGSGNHVDRVYLGRVGLHAELDARRHFAVPFSIDLGGSSTVAFHARLNLGLRVRIIDGLSIGLYPFNPTYTRIKNPSECAPHWAFASTVETSFTF
jgi:hypothetical protein